MVRATGRRPRGRLDQGRQAAATAHRRNTARPHARTSRRHRCTPGSVGSRRGVVVTVLVPGAVATAGPATAAVGTRTAEPWPSIRGAGTRFPRTRTRRAVRTGIGSGLQRLEDGISDGRVARVVPDCLLYVVPGGWSAAGARRPVDACVAACRVTAVRFLSGNQEPCVFQTTSVCVTNSSGCSRARTHTCLFTSMPRCALPPLARLHGNNLNRHPTGTRVSGVCSALHTPSPGSVVGTVRCVLCYILLYTYVNTAPPHWQ